MLRLHGVITPTAGPLSRMAINLTTAEPMLRKAFAPPRLAAVALRDQLAGRCRHPVRAGRRPDPGLRRRAGRAGAGVLRGRRRVRRVLACLRGRRDLRPSDLAGRIDRRGQRRLRAGRAARPARRRAPAAHRGSEQGAARPVPARAAPRTSPGWRACRPSCTSCSRGGSGSAAAASWPPETDLFTGEVWPGARAAELGLVDGLGTPAVDPLQPVPGCRAGTGSTPGGRCWRGSAWPVRRAHAAAGPDALLALLGGRRTARHLGAITACEQPRAHRRPGE